jgi:hypothetical protein
MRVARHAGSSLPAVGLLFAAMPTRVPLWHSPQSSRLPRALRYGRLGRSSAISLTGYPAPASARDGHRHLSSGALEGEVGLCAAHDKLGTVVLDVELRSGTYEPTVRAPVCAVRGLLFLDPGGLDALARRALQLKT